MRAAQELRARSQYSVWFALRAGLCRIRIEHEPGSKA